MEPHVLEDRNDFQPTNRKEKRQPHQPEATTKKERKKNYNKPAFRDPCANSQRWCYSQNISTTRNPSNKRTESHHHQRQTLQILLKFISCRQIGYIWFADTSLPWSIACAAMWKGAKKKEEEEWERRWERTHRIRLQKYDNKQGITSFRSWIPHCFTQCRNQSTPS